MLVFQNIVIQSLPDFNTNLNFHVVHPVITNDTHSLTEEML